MMRWPHLLIVSSMFGVVCSIPTGGKFEGSLTAEQKYTVHHMTLAKGGSVSLQAKASDENVPFTIEVNITEYQCANIDDKVVIQEYMGCVFHYKRSLRTSDVRKIDWLKKNAEITYCNGSDGTPYLASENGTSSKLFVVPRTSVYLVWILISNVQTKDFSVHYTLEMKNWFGYLNLIDYPGLIFYGVMMSVYILYALIWTVLMAMSYKDLIHLQFWVAVVIFLGMLEKAFFVSMYSTVNQDGSHIANRPLYIVAELISSAKKSLARMVLVIVSLGYGTVRPTLGSHLSKVLAVGCIYGIFSFLDGIIHSYSVTDNPSDNTEYYTLIPLVIIDSIILYWIFTNIMETRHVLKLRRNIVKLSFYNHLICMIMFAVVVAIIFMLWSIVFVRSSACLKDWKELWFDDAFWHILFSFLLGVIMFVWRPNTNSARFAYAVVDDEEEYEPVQGANENFETVKMRKFDKEPRVMPKSKLEDDLKWVEENLPSSAVDTILPLIADSDEELLTTKFEQSKMD